MPTELQKLAAARALLGGLAGGVASSVENQTLLDDSDPKLKAINLLLGTVTGAATPQRGIAKHVLSKWVPKQMGMFALDQYNKNVRNQIPIADKQLQTATKTLETAQINADAAKRMSAGDMAQLGLAGAGIGAAGGLGYYLWKNHGPGKKKAKPRITIDMPDIKGLNGADVKIEGDADTLDLSKSLYEKLRRDRRRVLLKGTGEQTEIRKKEREEERKKDACFITYAEPTRAERLQNIAEILYV